MERHVTVRPRVHHIHDTHSTCTVLPFALVTQGYNARVNWSTAEKAPRVELIGRIKKEGNLLRASIFDEAKKIKLGIVRRKNVK